MKISARKKLRKFASSMVCISIYAMSLGLCKTATPYTPFFNCNSTPDFFTKNLLPKLYYHIDSQISFPQLAKS